MIAWWRSDSMVATPFFPGEIETSWCCSWALWVSSPAGDSLQWRSNLRTCARLLYADAYRGKSSISLLSISRACSSMHRFREYAEFPSWSARGGQMAASASSTACTSRCLISVRSSVGMCGSGGRFRSIRIYWCVEALEEGVDSGSKRTEKMVESFSDRLGRPSGFIDGFYARLFVYLFISLPGALLEVYAFLVGYYFSTIYDILPPMTSPLRR